MSKDALLSVSFPGCTAAADSASVLWELRSDWREPGQTRGFEQARMLWSAQAKGSFPRFLREVLRSRNWVVFKIILRNSFPVDLPDWLTAVCGGENLRESSNASNQLSIFSAMLTLIFSEWDCTEIPELIYLLNYHYIEKKSWYPSTGCPGKRGRMRAKQAPGKENSFHVKQMI